MTAATPPTLHPLNGALRFFLELAALSGLGWWGYRQLDGVLRYGLMLALPVLAAVLWGVFAVPDDPSRGGQGLVKVPGLVRLALELVVLGGGAWAVYGVGQKWAGLAFAVCIVVHYAISYERIRWLAEQ